MTVYKNWKRVWRYRYNSRRSVARWPCGRARTPACQAGRSTGADIYGSQPHWQTFEYCVRIRYQACREVCGSLPWSSHICLCTGANGKSVTKKFQLFWHLVSYKTSADTLLTSRTSFPALIHLAVAGSSSRHLGRLYKVLNFSYSSLYLTYRNQRRCNVHYV